MHRLIKTLLLIPALSCFAIGFVPTASLGQVQTKESLNRPMEFVPPDLADRRRPNDRPKGGASRGGCSSASDQPPLTALVPIVSTTNVANESEPSGSDLGVEPANSSYEAVANLTTQPHPDFWFYVPYVLDGSIPLKFVLQDKDDNLVYQTEVAPVANSAGIVQMSLPDTLAPLAEGEAYHWFFIAQCDSRTPVFVEGWIERTPMTADMRSQLAQASPRDQAALYANSGIWQDALDTLVTLYTTNPSSPTLQEDWAELLTSAGLAEVAAEQFLGDVSTPPQR